MSGWDVFWLSVSVWNTATGLTWLAADGFTPWALAIAVVGAFGWLSALLAAAVPSREEEKTP